MPNYFYNSNFPDAAAYGQGLGQSLGQAMLGVPQQRAEMAMRLAQLQQMGGLRQQQQQFNQLREQDRNQYQQGLLQNAQQRAQDLSGWRDEKNQFNQQSLEQKGKYQDLAQQLAMMKLQQEANNIHKQVMSDGRGGFLFADQGGSPQIDPALQPANVNPNTLGQGAQIGLPGSMPTMQQQPVSAMPVQQGLPQQGGVPAGFRMMSAPPKATPGLTPDAIANMLTKNSYLKAGMLMSTNPVTRSNALSNDDLNNLLKQNIMDRLQGVQSMGQQQQNAPTNRVPIWNPITGKLE